MSLSITYIICKENQWKFNKSTISQFFQKKRMQFFYQINPDWLLEQICKSLTIVVFKKIRAGVCKVSSAKFSSMEAEHFIPPKVVKMSPLFHCDEHNM